MDNVTIDNLIIMPIKEFNKLQKMHPSVNLDFAVVKELDDKKAALRCLSRIIDYPGYNHKYISKAETLKQSILKA